MNDFRKQKDLKAIKAFVYEGINDNKKKNHINIDILDKITGKIFTGVLTHYGKTVSKDKL